MSSTDPYAIDVTRARVSPVGEAISREHLLSQFRGLKSMAGDAGARSWLVQRLERRAPEDWVEVVNDLETADLANDDASWLTREAEGRLRDPSVFHFLLGQKRRAANRPVFAETSFRATLARAPGFVDAAFSLAELLRESGRLEAARDILIALSEHLPPGDLDTPVRCSIFLRQCLRAKDALNLAERAIASGNSNATARFIAADLALTLGKFELARKHLELVLKSGPPSLRGHALMALAGAQRYQTKAHPDFQRCLEALRDPGMTGQQRAATLFALGKAFDDVGDYEGAANAWRMANSWVHDRTQWSAIAWRKFVDQQIQAPRPAFAIPPPDNFVPVFVVGLPRSGTTLTEQILARYPQVRSRGELNWLSFAWEKLSLAGALEDASSVYQASRLYYAHVRQDDAPAVWYIDKNPMNLRYLNLAVSMFPNARVIHCQRDLRDTAVSLYAQYFSEGMNEFAYDFGNIAAVARAGEQLMAHWKRVLPVPIFSLGYERLIERPAEVERELVAFLGLPDRVQDTHQETVISTSSRWQARQPLYRTAVNRWRAYAEHLPELMAAFPEVPDGA